MTTLQELMELIKQAEALGAKVTIHMDGRHIDYVEIRSDNDHKRLTIEHAAKLLRGLIAKDGGQ